MASPSEYHGKMSGYSSLSCLAHEPTLCPGCPCCVYKPAHKAIALLYQILLHSIAKSVFSFPYLIMALIVNVLILAIFSSVLLELVLQLLVNFANLLKLSKL